MSARRRALIALCGMVAGLLVSPAVPAQEEAIKVLVLDFGLLDGTLLPRVPDELARTASLGPALRVKLAQLGIDVLPYRSSPAQIAQTESGYLHAHPNELAALGREHGAQWVAIGQQNKFSFLISWLNVQLVDVETGLIVARAENALRGGMTEQRMTSRTMNLLGEQVNELLRELHRRKHAARAATASQPGTDASR